MDNIVLIGMPGCGKSTIGVLLAKMIGYNFIDSDILIQEKENKKLYKIIEENGLKYFKDIENNVNKNINVNNTVIATGGSVVYSSEAMKHLNEREHEIITLRCFNGKTQMEVADMIGISQAQVSRLEKNALKCMRNYLTA